MAGWVGGLTDENIAKAHALFFEAVEKSARPDKFSSENAEAEQNREPAGPGGDNHYDAQRKKRKTKHDFDPTLRLLHGLSQH